MPDDSTRSQPDQIVEAAVRAERERCLQLLYMFREEFRGAKLEHLWCRVYNLVAGGSLPPKMDPEIDPEAFPRNPGE